MASRNLWKAAKQICRRAEPLHAPMRSRPVVMGLFAVGLAAAAVALTSDAAKAQSDSGSGGSNSDSTSGTGGFAAGETRVQIGNGGTGGRPFRFGGSSFGSASDPKNHGMNFGNVRERCLEDDAFRRRNSTTCAHLLD